MVMYLDVMDRREASAKVAENIRSLALATGNTIESVASATDVAVQKLIVPPCGDPITLDELAAIGGFFSVPTASFLKGVAA